MKNVYARLIDKCRTPNQINRLHIAIENRATPAEMHQLSEFISSHYEESPSGTWINASRAMRNLSQKAEPEGYFRQKLGPNLYLYSNGAPTTTKTLILGFPGGAGRLMMPHSLLLQFLKADDADLLFINNRGPGAYVDGVPRLGSNFLEVISTLESVIRKLDYKRYVTLGTSAGGLAALFSAILLDFDRGTSVGSDVLDPKAWQQVLEHPKCRTLIAQKKGPPKLLGVYSVISTLESVIRKLDYKRYVTLGTSAGGLAALFSAILLDFDRGTSVGSDVLDPKAWQQVLEHPKCRTLIAQKKGPPKLLGVYSELFERDKLAAQDVSEKLPLVLLPVRAKIHNTLWRLLNTGDLPKLLSLVTMTEQTLSGTQP